MDKTPISVSLNSKLDGSKDGDSLSSTHFLDTFLVKITNKS